MLDFSSLDIRQGKDANNFFICCPFCIDRVGKVDESYKMGISVSKNIYHCFRCDASGNIDDSMKERMKFIEGDVHQTFLKDIKGRLSNIFRNYRDPETINLDIISSPINQDTPISLNYVKSRGLTEDDIVKYNIRAGKPIQFGDKEDGKWRGRIIFPFYRDSKCVFAVGRSYNGSTRKYLNTEGSKNTTVYGIDKVNGEAILCEGILSAIWAEKITGVPAVSCLGKSPLRTQLSMIRNKADTLYLSLDSDVAPREYEKVISSCYKLGFKMKFVAMPLMVVVENGERKVLSDPDDHKQRYLEYFNNAEEINIVNYKRLLRNRDAHKLN